MIDTELQHRVVASASKDQSKSNRICMASCVASESDAIDYRLALLSVDAQDEVDRHSYKATHLMSLYPRDESY